MNEVRFTITGDDSNLVIDRMRLGKGSVLVLEQNPPAHWSRFGQVGAPEPELVVAAHPIDDETRAAIENAPQATTPAEPEPVAPAMPGMPGVDDEDALRKEFSELAEMAGREDTTADGRWGVQRLKTEIETLKAEING